MSGEHPEPPDGTRIEFQEYGSPGGDLIAIHRDDASSIEAGWTAGDGGHVWCEYGYSVPIAWAEVLATPRLAACVNGTRLVPESALAAARSEGYAQARAEDIAALRDRDRWLEWWKTHPLTSFDEHLNDRAATYLASLTPTQEDGK